MKKSVEVILIFALISIILAFSNGYQTLTGMQALDLPEPPPPPGMTSDQQVQPTTTPTPTPAPTPTPTADAARLLAGEIPEGETIAAINAKLAAIEQKLRALDLLPAWEQRLNNVEAQAAIASDMSARIDGLQSQVDGLRVDVDNLKGRPYFDAPAFTDELQRARASSTKNTVLSISLSVVALIIVISMIVTHVMERRKEYLSDKKLLRQYLLNYQKAGYRLETLRMHLLASGWSGWFVDEVLKELPK
jgi:hypothetical protein